MPLCRQSPLLCLPQRSPLSTLADRRGDERGAVLLEVVLALVLFVLAAAIIGGGLSASINSVERMRLNTQAADLAATVAAELELGIRTLDETGPAQFDPPFDGWTWEIIPTTTTTPSSTTTDETTAPTFVVVEIVVRHEDPPIVHRLTRSIHLDNTATQDAGETESLEPF